MFIAVWQFKFESHEEIDKSQWFAMWWLIYIPFCLDAAKILFELVMTVITSDIRRVPIVFIEFINICTTLIK